jgi:hypothetical protein
MDTLTHYREIIREVLSRYVDIRYSNADLENDLICDVEKDRYLVLSQGWGVRPRGRIHGCLLHVDLIDGKVWIQRDGTEDGIAGELEDAGIPKSDIVLGFHPPNMRKHTEYAA